MGKLMIVINGVEISPLVIGIAIVALIVLSIMNIHNSLNRKKLYAERAWSNIDTYLQQRFDELESLFNQMLTVMDSESETQKEIARMRSMVSDANATREPEQMMETYNQTNSFMRGFHIENYPQLQSMKQAFYTAQRTSTLETNLNSARRLYNSNVTKYNMAIINFPSNIFAGMFGHSKMPLFEAEEYATQRPRMASEGYISQKYKAKEEELEN